MKSKRSLRTESLESRRLLAVFGETSLLPEGTPLPPQVETIIGGSDLLREATENIELSRPLIFPGLSHGPDLVQEVAGRLFVVDQAPLHSEGGSLLVFERTAAGGLELLEEVKLGVHVNRMIVHGDQVVLIGNNFDWRILAIEERDVATNLLNGDDWIRPIPHFPNTLAITVNLGDEVSVVRQELAGFSHTIHDNGGELVVVSSQFDAVIAIYPPPELLGLVTTYDITKEGLVATASTKISMFGTSVAQGDDFYNAATKPSDIVFFDRPAEITVNSDGIVPPQEPVPPTVSVTRYFLGDDGIREVESVDLGLGFLTHFEVAEDGLTGVAVFTEFNRAGSTTTVALLDLSGKGVQVFESIRLDDFHGQVIVGGPDFVVLRSWVNHSLVIINADQSIDPLPENRIQKLELPQNLHVDSASLRFGDRLVLRGRQVPNIEPVPLDANGVSIAGATSDLTFAPQPEGRSVLLVVSLPKAQIIADTHFPGGTHADFYEDLFLIDASEQRFGLVVRTAPPSDALATDANGVVDSNVVNGWTELNFLFGRLTETGEFQRDGAIAMGHWLEIDVTPDRLIARLHDRIEEYDWANPDDPKVIRLPHQLPPIEAVNDEYRLHDNGEDHLLRVLANDQVHRRHEFPAVQIVELIGAPEGTEIIEGQIIRVPAAALEGVDSLRFEYVISDGEQQSQAVVEISVISITDEQVKELIEAVRRQAAEDFNVPVEDVQVTSVERIFDQPLPIVLPNDPNHLDLSPGILVVITVPNGTALYAANFQGQIIQVFASHRAFLAELSLEPVDANGEPLAEIREGDEFFLQFNAKDLRLGGLGVYAAFFDLQVPTDQLVITGPVEFGPGFAGIPGSEFTEGRINELGAIGTEIDSPGNGLQEVLRIGVRAVAAGKVTLRPNPADEIGNETLLRGRETEVPEERVRYLRTELEILAADTGNPFDVDDDGEATAKDALIVINFLGRHGTVALADLPRVLGGVGIEGESVSQTELERMMRYDTNGNGTISAVDALVIINRLNVIPPVTTAEAEELALIDDEAAPMEGLGKAEKI